MIRVISSLLLVCLYAVSAAASSGGTPKTLKIMAYNIQHGADATTRVDLMRTAEAIRAVAPDIVFLSEVDQHWRRSGMVDQPQVLAEALGMPYVHFDPAPGYPAARRDQPGTYRPIRQCFPVKGPL